MPISTQNINAQDNVDVIIVGGGAAGIAAAIGARQAAPQASILLLESEGCLGGAATHRGVVSYCGLFTVGEHPQQVVGKIWEILRDRLLEFGGTGLRPVRHRGVFQVVEPEVLKVVLDDIMIEHRVEVLLHTTVVDAYRGVDGQLTHAVIQERRGRRQVYAQAFVDCSGDCDLAFHCGASTRYGNHGTLNLGSLALRFGGFGSNANPTAALWREAIVSAKARRPELRKAIIKDQSVLIRLPLSGDVVAFLPSATYDARISASITAAEISGRKQAQEYLKILQSLPGHERMYLVSTGPNFGTRESRHINAVYRLTEDDILLGREFKDNIALGGWGFEFHDEHSPSWESSFRIPNQLPFQIPLRSLQSVDTSNLFVAGRCVDGDQYAGSAVRVMGTALATGQAAGVAAGLLSYHASVEDWSYLDVQNCLRDNGALLVPSDLPGPCVVDVTI